MQLACVGDVMLDIRVDAHLMKRGGDVHGRVLLQPGGTSANAAVWGAWSGGSACVFGRVGDDLAGRTLRSALADRGVDAVLSCDPHAPTGTMFVLHESDERSMVADRGANARMAPSDLPAEIEADAVLVSGYLLLQEEGHDVAIAALDRARSPLVAVETASWPLVESFGPSRFFAETAGATVVLTNEMEARALVGMGAPDAARVLGERYRVAAVKRGAGGAALAVDGEIFLAPAESVSELDPTGAGDAFDGVLLVALASGISPEEALARACHGGALAAASLGSWPEPGTI